MPHERASQVLMCMVDACEQRFADDSRVVAQGAQAEGVMRHEVMAINELTKPVHDAFGPCTLRTFSALQTFVGWDVGASRSRGCVSIANSFP